jgi:hypothetical protein
VLLGCPGESARAWSLGRAGSQSSQHCAKAQKVFAVSAARSTSSWREPRAEFSKRLWHLPTPRSSADVLLRSYVNDNALEFGFVVARRFFAAGHEPLQADFALPRGQSFHHLPSHRPVHLRLREALLMGFFAGCILLFRIACKVPAVPSSLHERSAAERLLDEVVQTARRVSRVANKFARKQIYKHVCSLSYTRFRDIAHTLCLLIYTSREE